MSFSAYGVFIEVDPVVKDSGVIKLSDDTEDHRAVFVVKSVGSKVEGIVPGNVVYVLRTSKFVDKGTGVSVRACHMSEVIAVAPDGEGIEAVPPIEIVGPIGDSSLN